MGGFNGTWTSVARAPLSPSKNKKKALEGRWVSSAVMYRCIYSKPSCMYIVIGLFMHGIILFETQTLEGLVRPADSRVNK